MQKSDVQIIEMNERGDIERLRSVSMKRASLEVEIKTLREALAQVAKSMENGEERAAKIGGVVARLSDSIVRALVAQQELSAQDEGFTWLRAQFDRMLRELGYGEET